MKNIFDQTYNELVSDVLKNGNSKMDRTQIGTLSKFGCNMKFDISMYFPLLTNKRVYFKGVVEELLWMLRGDTNANNLSKQNVKIWDANGSREFLDNLGTAPGTAVLFSYISMLFVLRLCLIQDVVEVTLRFWALKIPGVSAAPYP